MIYLCLLLNFSGYICPETLQISHPLSVMHDVLVFAGYGLNPPLESDVTDRLVFSVCGPSIVNECASWEGNDFQIVLADAPCDDGEVCTAGDTCALLNATMLLSAIASCMSNTL